MRCVRWYTYRWLIERYYYTLKSGCGIEKLQLETARRIDMALATFSIVAWRLLWLTYEARFNPEQPCDTILEASEWQRQSPQVGKPAHGAGSSLCATINKNPIPPEKPPSIHEAVRMIASLSGFLGRKGDGEPGVKTKSAWVASIARHHRDLETTSPNSLIFTRYEFLNTNLLLNPIA